MSREEISVVIVNYRTSHLIKELLESIVEEQVSLKVIIVDNASTAESWEQLQAIRDDRLILLRSRENQGFTGGVNTAITYIAENLRHSRYMFLMNPDAKSTPRLIGRLREVMEADNSIAAVSPRISDLKGDIWYCGANIGFNKGAVLAASEIEKTAERTVKEIDVFSGCAVLFDLSKIVKAGMFNQRLFMYYDEADLSIRLKDRGFKIMYDPSHTIFHDVSYTTRHISYLKTYYMTRNKFIVFNKTMSLYHKMYFLLYELAFHLKNGRLKNAYYHLKGYLHFLSGKTGAYMS